MSSRNGACPNHEAFSTGSKASGEGVHEAVHHITLSMYESVIRKDLAWVFVSGPLPQVHDCGDAAVRMLAQRQDATSAAPSIECVSQIKPEWPYLCAVLSIE